MTEHIFVQIAAYRDPQLLPTLRDCLAKAARPDLLRFGLAWQHDREDDLAEFAHDPRFRIFACHWRESEGVCWARHRLQQFYDGEAFTLMLDSHHRFAPGWDARLKRELNGLPSVRPVLTGYLPPFLPGAELMPSKAIVLGADRFDASGGFHYRPFPAGWRKLLGHRGLRARFLSAHFAFARGDFLEHCGHDPHLYFLGEEVTLSVRAFTHGFDLFHPRLPVAWHYYNRNDAPKHWEDHISTPDSPAGGDLRDQLSRRRVRQLLGMEPTTIEFGRFGLGTVRSLAQYERMAGIDFAARTISGAAKSALPVSA